MSSASCTKEMFLSHVDKRPDGCWIWTGPRSKDGYGKIPFRGNKWARANRVAFALFKGPVPAGAFACHTCDVPLCVNPEHLFTGTAADNTHDMHAKGRAPSAVGESNGRAKLTEADVLDIRKRAAAGESCATMALQYGVAKSTVRDAVSGRKWSHLPLEKAS